MDAMTPKIVGVVGKIGSGKDEALKYLKARYSVPFLSTGDIVRALAEKEGLPPTRENLETISEQCFIELGEGCFVRMVAGEIKKLGWHVAGISGIRSPADVLALKEIFGSDFVLLRVDVKDPELRFNRLLGRHEGRDPEKFADFQAQDRNEEEIFHIDKASSMADFSISNDGTLEDFHKQIDRLAARNRLPTAPPKT
jgi:dephospho-CoA kinase